jgi:hypothetical protein
MAFEAAVGANTTALNLHFAARHTPRTYIRYTTERIAATFSTVTLGPVS